MAAQPLALEGLTPINHGWLLSNFLGVKWFDVEEVPNVIGKIENNDNSEAENSDIDDSDEESESDREI